MQMTVEYSQLQRTAGGLHAAAGELISTEELIAAGTQIVAEALQTVAPRRTGAGMASIHAQGNGIWAYRYMKWQDEGTGIYGPRGTPIVPVRATVLRFVVDGNVVFARSVKGTEKHKGWVRMGAEESKPALRTLMLENGRKAQVTIRNGG